MAGSWPSWLGLGCLLTPSTQIKAGAPQGWFLPWCNQGRNAGPPQLSHMLTPKTSPQQRQP